MKRFLSAVLAAAMLASLAGCSGGTSSTGSVSDSSLTESASEPAAQTTSDSTSQTAIEQVETPENIDYLALSEQEIYDLMVQRSLMTTGDMTRMANVLKKAQNGEEITVAYIGGSITYGMTVAPNEPEKCWAYLTYKWLCEQFPEAKINYVNAGISGTPSILGNVRLERDVLAYDPDIVFVEFAVNDGNANEYKYSYESLVRTLLTQEKDIAVALFFTIIKSGHTCQPHMSQIGANYNLPMISEPDSIWVEMQEGRMTWEDYSDDESHPNEYGHSLVADLIENYFSAVMESLDENVGEVSRELPAPVFSDRFVDMHYIDSEKLEVTELVGFEPQDTHSDFHNGWAYKGSEGASMKFTLNCKSLQLIYKANKMNAFADADIYVDGEKRMTVSSNQPDGWNNPVTALIIDNDEAAEHEVEIRVEGGSNKYFGVLGFGYCD
ncbi:MAG: SGNH/GDSL hydrolase family protein [Oscillospiraceae bacterium]